MTIIATSAIIVMPKEFLIFTQLRFFFNQYNFLHWQRVYFEKKEEKMKKKNRIDKTKKNMYMYAMVCLTTDLKYYDLI